MVQSTSLVVLLFAAVCASISDVAEDRQDALLYSNGNIITHIDSGGIFLSAATGNLYGLACGPQYYVIENFTIPEEVEWVIDEVEIFAFQSNSGVNSTITGLYLAIYSSNPIDGSSNYVWGNISANILTSTTFSNIYRVGTMDNVITTRPVMRNFGAVDTTLPSGQYWIMFTLTGSLANGPYCPISDGGEVLRLYTPSHYKNTYEKETPFKFYGSIPEKGAVEQENKDKKSSRRVPRAAIIAPVVIAGGLLILLAIFLLIKKMKKSAIYTNKKVSPNDVEAQ